MEYINIDADVILNGLKTKNNIVYYYRKFVDYDNDNILGLYYKKFLDLEKLNVKSLNKRIELHKEIRDEIDGWNWEYSIVGGLLKKAKRIVEAQKDLDTNLGKPIISGIALYHNYPVGTFFPKELLNYQDLFEILDNNSLLSREDKIRIFERVKEWVICLMEHDVYTFLYAGNVLVNPHDYSDVVLGGLDGPGICRVETGEYVKKLAKKGLDLRKRTMHEYDELKNKFVR